MPRARIATYFQELANPISPASDVAELVDLHTRSFERHGWEVVLVDERDARRHPRYALFDDPRTILGTSRNPWEYTRACYMRWLAYAVTGLPFADLDVINYGFTPADAAAIQAMKPPGRPIFLAQAGAMGLFDAGDYAQVIGTYVDFAAAPVIAGPLLDDVNDMTIMRHLHIDWYDCIPYADPRFVKDYTGPLWEQASLVHYPYSTTAQPRAATVLAKRPPPA